jgi:hypothetical protein
MSGQAGGARKGPEGVVEDGSKDRFEGIGDVKLSANAVGVGIHEHAERIGNMQSGAGIFNSVLMVEGKLGKLVDAIILDRDF